MFLIPKQMQEQFADELTQAINLKIDAKTEKTKRELVSFLKAELNWQLKNMFVEWAEAARKSVDKRFDQLESKATTKPGTAKLATPKKSTKVKTTPAHLSASAINKGRRAAAKGV